MYVCIYNALGKPKVHSTSGHACIEEKLVAWTLKMAHICYDYDHEVAEHILDLTKRPNAFMETDQGRKTESITHTR